MWGGRFDEPPDREFYAFQRSFGFDAVLLPQEIAASQAWAGALVGARILTAAEGEAIRGALDEIPTLRMIRLGAAEIERRSRAFSAAVAGRVPANELEIEVVPGHSVVGGGSTPDQHLPTYLVRLSTLRYSAGELEARLRQTAAGLTPVIARIENDRLVLDLRTVDPGEESALLEAVFAAIR